MVAISDPKLELGGLHVSNLENVFVLDDYVIHVHGLELVEILREGDEVDGVAFVELKKVRVVVVALPTKRVQHALQDSIRGDNLVGGCVNQHLIPPPSTTRVPFSASLTSWVLYKPHHPVLENPHPRHYYIFFSSPRISTTQQEEEVVKKSVLRL